MRRVSLGLGTRIALTILGAMLAIQVLNSVLFLLLPRPPFNIYSARWIIDKTSKAVNTLARTPQSAEDAVAKHFNETTGLILGPPRRRGPKDGNAKAFGPLQRLSASLSVALAADVRELTVRQLFGPPDARPVMVPAGFEEGLPRGALSASEPDLAVFGGFEILFKLNDGRQFMISQPKPARLGPAPWPAILSFGGAILLISLLSAWTAKRTLTPLEGLVAAARRMGSERVPTPIETTHLGDFAAIGNAMNEMQARIGGFVDERTQILAAISHDLRTALTRLRLDAETVSEHLTRQRLVTGIEDMNGMISATLTFAGNDLEGERSGPLDVAALLITITDDFDDLGVMVTYVGPDHAQLLAQPTALRRALINLIDNAIKYGGSAEIALKVMDDGLSITVADSGPGIPSDQIGRAFEPFSRLEQSRSRETGGVGLGLTIARDIVRAHGGSLTLSNRSQGGLLATVWFPAAVPQQFVTV